MSENDEIRPYGLKIGFYIHMRVEAGEQTIWQDLNVPLCKFFFFFSLHFLARRTIFVAI